MALLAAAPARAAAASCPESDTGITLPPGFCATVFADDLGHVRQMAVSPDNVLYANSWSGRYYAEINDRIVRYARKPGETKPSSREETVISALPLTGLVKPTAVEPAGDVLWIGDRGADKAVAIPLPK